MFNFSELLPSLLFNNLGDGLVVVFLYELVDVEELIAEALSQKRPDMGFPAAHHAPQSYIGGVRWQLLKYLIEIHNVILKQMSDFKIDFYNFRVIFLVF